MRASSVKFGFALVSFFAVKVFAAEAKPSTFEDALVGAEPVTDLAQLVEPLFADCKREDDLATRQCASIRDWMIDKLHEGTYWAVGDESALSWAPYDPAEKKIELEVDGCLACGRPLTVDGKPRFVTTRVPKAIKSGHAVGLDVGFQELPQADEKAATEFEQKMKGRLRVQFVFKVGPVWKSGTGDKSFEGVTFVPVAYRIFDRCSGKVLASDPPTTDAKGALQAMAMTRDASCPVELTDEQKKAEEWKARPEQLSPKQINAALAGARERVRDCYTEFQQAGTATVKLVVSREGSIETMTLAPPFDKTPTGYCIRTAIKGTSFPHFKQEKMLITYPFQLP
jgi:hypothetical protein